MSWYEQGMGSIYSSPTLAQMLQQVARRRAKSAASSVGTSTDRNADWKCPPGEHAMWGDPAPELLDGVMVDPPPQWSCVPDDPLEMVPPPGAAACPLPPYRAITAQTGEKGPWACPNACTNGRSAILGEDLRWRCPSGSSPADGFPSFGGSGAPGGQNGSTTDELSTPLIPGWAWAVGAVSIAAVSGFLIYKAIS